MHTDPISNHLANYKAAEDSRKQLADSLETTRSVLVATMSENLAARMRAEVLPILENSAAFIRDAGYHALVAIGERAKDGPPPWVIAITLSFECSRHSASKGTVSDLSFLAEVDPDLDFWRVRSYALSQSDAVRDAVPDATFLPGAQPLAAFVTARITALVKAAFPIQP